MKNDVGKKIGMAACVFVMIAGIITLVMYIGGFFPKIADFFSKEEETETIVETEPVYAAEPQGPVNGMNAIVIEKGVDFKEAQKSFDIFSAIASWDFNTVIFSGCDIADVTQLASQAKSNGLYSVYMIGSDSIVRSGVPNKEAAISLLGTGVDSLLIAPAGGAAINEVALAANVIRELNPSAYIGVYAQASKQYSPVCVADVFDYKYVDVKIPSSEIAGDYSKFISAYCDGTTKDNVFCMHTEFIGNSKGYEKPDEILKQFSAVTSVENSGYSFYRYGIFSKDNDLRNAIIDFKQNGILKDYFKELVISSPKKTKFETNQSLVSFVGTGDITKPLTLNGQAVEMIDDGYFSVEKQLTAGKNVFVFEHNGKKITYTITYKIKLIDSVMPSSNVSAPGGTALDVIAVAHKSADVTATLGGVTISLVRSDEYDDNTSVDDASDYTNFVGTFNLPESAESDTNLGKIKFTAKYQGMTESKSAATVTVNAIQEFVPPAEEIAPEETSADDSSTQPAEEDSSVENEDSSIDTPTKPEELPDEPKELFELLTPYKNNGVSGKSKMIVVKKEYAETLPASTMNDVSVPYFTFLPKGTVDYVVNTSTFDGFKYYVLSSGRRVYQTDVEYLSAGYNMPSNEIRTVGIAKESDKTKITLSMKWKVPFNVREHPQDFYTQISGRPYSVRNFTAEYIDIVFYHTTKVDTMPSINTSVISKAQWITNGNGTVTLRLSLNKKGGFYGIKYYYNSDGTLTLSVKERQNSSISGKVIMLDPGHGGNDPGAIGTTVVNGKRIYEETINLAIAKKVKSKLEAMGATVIMTRNSSSTTLELDSRAALHRAKNPDVVVSIHCDASETSSSASGTSAYYYKSYSYPLAKHLSTSIVSAYKSQIYARNSAMANKVDRGAMFKGFRVTRIEECPSVLIEYGFVTNVTECNALANDNNRDILAQATVDGLVAYFKNS